MIRRSFCCFEGVSPDAERRLWHAGALAWNHLQGVSPIFSKRKMSHLLAQLPAMESALTGLTSDFFLQRLPVGYRLRAWPHMSEHTAFLDIETTGLERYAEVTVIGMYFRRRLDQFVLGRDIHRFLEHWGSIRLLITFNGLRFDVPMIARHFKLKNLPPQIDLMHEARYFGFTKGLKVVEKAFGFRRTTEGVYGANAVALWHDYIEKDDESSLLSLLRYNAEDVLSLLAAARKLLRRSFDGYPAPLPDIRRLV